MKEDVCYLDLVADLSGYSNKLGYDFECGRMKNQEFKVAGYGPKNKFKIILLNMDYFLVLSTIVLDLIQIMMI